MRSDYGFEIAAGGEAAGNDWAVLKHKRDAYVARLNGIYATQSRGQGRGARRGARRTIRRRPHRGGRMARGSRRAHVVIATGGISRGAASAGRRARHHLGRLFRARAPGRSAWPWSAAATSPASWRRAFQALGSQVELFIRKDHLLTHFDAMLGKSLMREMLARRNRDPHRVVPAAVREQSGSEDAGGGGRARIRRLRLRAMGDRPGSANMAGLDLRAAGVALERRGFIAHR